MPERKTVFRWWWIWSFEKEEQWLNDMAADGWLLDSVGFCVFRFVRSEDTDYTVHLELRGAGSGYEGFLDELGAEYIGRVVGWIYFRQRGAAGAYQRGDMDARLEQLARIAKMLAAIGAANILIGVANSINGSHLGFINLLCGCLLMYALGRIRGKEEELKKERVLHE